MLKSEKESNSGYNDLAYFVKRCVFFSFVIAAFIGSIYHVNAQSNENKSPFEFLKVKVDTTFIRSYSGRPHITFDIARRLEAIEIQSPTIETLLLRYEVNSRFNFITSFDYRWLSIAFSLFNFQPADGAQKGSSNTFSLRLNANGRRIWSTNFLQVNEGFHLSNPLAAYPNWNGLIDPYPQRSDMASVTLFSNVSYCFSPERFSYRASLWQLDRQEKSAGSFITGLSTRIGVLLSDTNQTLIPGPLYDQFPSQTRLIEQRISNLSFNFGYIHTFVYKRDWFLTIYLLPGLSFQNGIFRTEDLNYRSYRSEITGSSEFRFVLGHNGDTWFYGLSSHSFAYSGNQRMQLRVNNSYSAFRLFCGYRLKAPARTKAKLLRKIGL